jgi:hypothetical protein
MLQLYTHAVCLQHDPGPGHAESPARLRAVLKALDQDRFAVIDRVEAPRATREQLLRVHTADHVDRILSITPVDETVRLDEDTLMSPGVGRSGAACRWRLGGCRRCSDARVGESCVLRGASARSSRHGGYSDGLLPVQQCRGGGSTCAGGTRIEARRHRRLRCPPRQRHAGHLPARTARPVSVQPSVSALSGHG